MTALALVGPKSLYEHPYGLGGDSGAATHVDDFEVASSNELVDGTG